MFDATPLASTRAVMIASHLVNTILSVINTRTTDIIDYASKFNLFYDTQVKYMYAKKVSNLDSRSKLVEGLKLLQSKLQTKDNTANAVTK
jgi:hypothetical protein